MTHATSHPSCEWLGCPLTSLDAVAFAGAAAEESAGTNSRQAGGGGSAPLPQKAGLSP